MVPVVRNVESMNYAEIELAINALGEKARKGALAVEDMDGGTFTISNGGVFGSLMGTPIINPPQSAILGMHAIFDRPVAIKGQVIAVVSLLQCTSLYLCIHYLVCCLPVHFSLSRRMHIKLTQYVCLYT